MGTTLAIYVGNSELPSSVPFDLSVIIGDVIHNIRTSLDLLACDLVRLSGESDKNVYFPFCDTPNDLMEMIKKRRLHRAGKDVVEVMLSLRPYKGGNVALRAIHDLDVDDKHKALIPTFSIAVTGEEDGLFPFYSPITVDGQLYTVMREELSSLPIGAEVKTYFALLFPPGTSLGGREMIPTLHELANLADGIIDTFALLRPGAEYPTPPPVRKNPGS